MHKEPKCLVCTEPATRIAVTELRAQGHSIRDIASRVDRSRASVCRHLKHAGISGRDKSAPKDQKSTQTRRKTTGRCKACGTLADDPTPQALVKRAERTLFFGEQIMAKAIEDEDFRLALQALNQARASLEQLMKVHGLLQPEGGSSTIIDARKQVFAVLGSLSEADLRRLAGGGETTLVDVTDNRALTSERTGFLVEGSEH